MNWSIFFRKVHRWLSMIFTAVVIGIFITLAMGNQPAAWVYYLPLFPLAFLMLTGLYMFALPYAANWRSRRQAS